MLLWQKEEAELRKARESSEAPPLSDPKRKQNREERSTNSVNSQVGVAMEWRVVLEAGDRQKLREEILDVLRVYVST